MSGLRLILNGLLFTVINIRIQGFDILPDMIGYIIVITGLGRIQQYDEKFVEAKKAAYVLAVLSAINIVEFPADQGANMIGSTSVNFSAGILGNDPLLAMLLMMAGLAAQLYFTYNLCMGMKALLYTVGDETLAKLCDDRWRLILVAELGLFISLVTALVGFSLSIVLALIFGILSLVAMVLFLLLIHHTHRSVGEKSLL